MDEIPSKDNLPVWSFQGPFQLQNSNVFVMADVRAGAKFAKFLITIGHDHFLKIPELA